MVLTVEQAARELGLGITKTRELVASERLKVVRIDRRVVVPEDSVRAFLEAHSVGGEATGQDSAATGSAPAAAQGSQQARRGRRSRV